MVYEFIFPDVGEGITEGEIVKWLVKEGDKINENDNVVQIETDKAVVDIPTPKSGKVLKLHFKVGDTIKVGQSLMSIDDGTGGAVQQKSKEVVEEKTKERKSVSVVGDLEEASDKEEKVEKRKLKKTETPKDHVLAVPRVRALAKKLGVNISRVKGSGSDGRVTDDDVIAASRGTSVQKPVQQIKVEEKSKVEGVPKIKIAKKYDMWGYIDRIPLKGVRKIIAKNMVKSFQSVAPVTAMMDVDVTKLWDLREKEKVKAEKKGVKLTFFPYIIRAVIEGLKKHPYLNSELQEEEIIIKKYYNIGIAVDAAYGLIVPVLKRAEIKSLYDIAKEIVDLANKAKDRKLDIMDMKGGSFTITNYGSIGTNYGTPIINPPESAILGLGRIFDRVVFIDGKVENRKIFPLSLTFDHRILDGAEAARFLGVVKEYLEEPSKIKFEGDKTDDKPK